MPIRLAAALTAVATMAAVAIPHAAAAFDSVCPPDEGQTRHIGRVLGLDTDTVRLFADKYCANVGKKAYNTEGWKVVKKFEIGRIDGVTFAEMGAPASEKQGERLRTVRPGFYYVIAPGAMYKHPTLRYAPEINAR